MKSNKLRAKNTSDSIEEYIKQLLAQSGIAEIKRSNLADTFQVVPSQINYVIKTRFTIQNGYLVESKRGGGGYIRIEKVNLVDDADVLDALIQVIGDSITQRDAYAVVQSLYEDDVLNRREAQLILVAIDHDTLGLTDRDLENSPRARIIIGLLNHLRYES